MSLIFETALPSVPASPRRADVACFIGFIARRHGVALPSSVHEELRTAGWVQGPWRRSEADLQSLENLPVTVDSWEAFARLFAWEARPLQADDVVVQRSCTTYLGAAVRSFFAHGGRRAVIIRAGDPWPYLESATDRAVRRPERLVRLVPDFAPLIAPQHPFDSTNPSTWRGIEHLYGLPEVSICCLPDLPDACAIDPAEPLTVLPPPIVPESFVECSENDPPLPEDRGLRLLPAPRLDNRSYASWRLAITGVREFFARHRRGEVMMIASLPLPHVDARRVKGNGWIHAESDMLDFLNRSGAFDAAGGTDVDKNELSNACVQLVYPWLRTRESTDLPQSVEPPDGLMAGLIAANALSRGTFHSIAGRFSLRLLNDVVDTLPSTSWGGGPDSPSDRLAARVCVFAPTPDGISLQSDVTAAPTSAWRFGGAVRVMGALLRTARQTGEALLFDGSGPELWNRVRRGIEDLLDGFWRIGALVGNSAIDAYTVRCDRSTMTQNDIDNGRLIVEMRLRPATSISRITVVLNLASSAAGAGSLREVA